MDIFSGLWAHLRTVVTTINDWLGLPEFQVLKWVLAALAAYYVARLLVPTWRILALSLYKDLPWSWMRSFGDLWKLRLFTLSRDKWYRAARMRVEWELLRPRPEKPARHRTLPQHRRDQIETRKQATERYKKEYADYELDLALWKTKLDGHLNNLSIDDGAPVEVPDVSKLLARADEICNYFGVLATDWSAHRYSVDRFVSKVKVQRGFVAPLHLLSGLLAETEEDWGPVIADYGRQLADPMPKTRDPHGDLVDFGIREAELRLQRLQGFLFDCWLLWGPSIPLCTCEAWHGGRPILQFGFGDESNSLALLPGRALSTETLRGFFASERVLGNTPVVKVASVTGVLQWGPSLLSSDINQAQQIVCDPDEDRLALLVEDLPEPAGGKMEDLVARYYSAYLWAMFVICDPQGAPVYRGDRQWRGLLPFFEHANLAEEQPMTMLKRHLAVKTLSSVLRLLRELPRLRLRLVCAIDDSGCGCDLLCPPPPSESVAEVMCELVAANDAFADLRPGGALHDRLHLVPVARGQAGGAQLWENGNYSSCNFPQLIAEYYGYLKEDSESEPDAQTRMTAARPSAAAASA